jgi:hypothetical protein
VPARGRRRQHDERPLLRVRQAVQRAVQRGRAGESQGGPGEGPRGPEPDRRRRDPCGAGGRLVLRDQDRREPDSRSARSTTGG